MQIPVRAKGRGRAKAIYSSYGDLAGRLLPAAEQISFFGAGGELEWTRGARNLDASSLQLVGRILSGNLVDPQVLRLSARHIAVAIPINVDGRPVSILQVIVTGDQAGRTQPPSDVRIMRDTAGAAAPLVDCLCRELAQSIRKSLPAATLSERTEELEWLFSLTEKMHSHSSDPRAISQLLGAAVEHMRASFGAVVVPEHGLELKYSSMIRFDRQSGGIFDRCNPYFMNFVMRRKQPLIANKAKAGSNMPPFKVLLLPIEPHKGKVIGYTVFLKAAGLPSFGRRQLFLGRHIGHQVGTLLESQYDLATGLLTRNAFEQDVLAAIAAAPESAVHALLYFDIDGLHVINDVLGFGCGDEAIVRVAELFHAPVLPEEAVSSRIGGDSFLIYLPGHDAEQAAARARVILRDATRCSVGSGDKSIALSLSCGVVRIHLVRSNLSDAIATAQRACAGCKQSGGNRLEIHLDIDAATMRRKAEGVDVSQIRKAITEGRFCVYSQKIVSSIDSNQIHGIECLVRMQGDAGKLIAPADFFPTAERHRLLKAIDHWVISTTLRAIRPFRTMLLEAKVTVAINISAQCMQDDAFVESIEGWLADSRIAPGLILFEIAESAAVANLSRAGRLMSRLRRQGCRFALDDFGTGLNSLSYLQTLPVSQVKIDGSFTHELLSDERSAAMVKAIVLDAASLGIESVAECVESLPVAQRVRDLGVDYLQGFVVHRPEPLRQVLDSIDAGRSQRRHEAFLTEP